MMRRMFFGAAAVEKHDSNDKQKTLRFMEFAGEPLGGHYFFPCP